MWNWQQSDWPNFSYELRTLTPYQEQFLKNSGEFVGILKHISDEERDFLKIELLSDESIKTSEIEGEMLNRESVQSSLRNQFGLQADERLISAKEKAIAMMMVNLYKTFIEPLSKEGLCSLHQILLGQEKKILDLGRYRTHEEPMQIVSGPVHRRKVHFEAPPSNTMEKEMADFIKWFNDTAPKSKNPLPALIRASIAHLYFVSIHPFEDGNGRIARALSEKALAQNFGFPTLIALSYTIEKKRKDYYSALERAHKKNEITKWIAYFSETILEAQKNTQARAEFVIKKTKLFDRLRGKLNKRQEKVLDRMFREGPDGFKGGLSAENYLSIAKTSRATATRDLQDLVEKRALRREGELRYTRYYLAV